ncbi:tRNA (N(6)-L-threonylcarbamoyladenosine(37)-C(2))-methylthiotransferase [Candidatus Woesearchaeota archaeon]|nr:tRNA (N(6)-L-threonylcarbamoyladenosine(37)-C(2))-methylthiotransferase [Candidatus Woesearchaeota archaeon]
MKKVFINTYGCAHNQADSEFMAGQLKQEGFEIIDSKKSADLVLINTCSVKDPSEKKFFSELKRINKPVVVAGCVPQADKNNPVLKNYSLIGVKQIHNIVEVVHQTLAGNKVHLLKQSKDVHLNLPRIRRNPLVEIIPISSGCLGYCTFCKTKFARGSLLSFKEEVIIKQIRTALNEGVKEIWLTSEDTGPYGLDIGTTLPKLLKNILKIQKDFRVRLGMINPEYVKRYDDALIDIYKDERMFKFLHVPVQSGNDRILKLMKREYTIEEFKKTVIKLRKGVPELTVATDIICGFSSETDYEFLDTLELVREFKFPVLHISKFYPRPGTKAAKMEKLNTKIVKKRSRVLTALNEELVTNKEWLGWKGEIMIDEKGKNKTFVGRNNSYRPIVVKGKDLFGKRIKVRIVDVFRDYLKGEII